jgi:hypothetical protein
MVAQGAFGTHVGGLVTLPGLVLLHAVATRLQTRHQRLPGRPGTAVAPDAVRTR